MSESFHWKSLNQALWNTVSLSSSEAQVKLKQLRKNSLTEGFAGLLPQQFKPRAFFVDMDGTIIQQESMSHIALSPEKLKIVDDLTEQAMNGEISFNESFKKRLLLLEGMSAAEVSKTREKLTLNEGISKLSHELKRREIPLFVVSGGLSLIAEAVASHLEVQEVFANHIEIIDGKLAGRLSQPIVDSKAKVKFVKQKCAELGFSPSECVAVGDGANDRLMFAECGLAVGFHPRKALLPYCGAVNASGDHSLMLDFLDAKPSLG